MVEVSTSILSVDQEKSVKTFYDLETAKTDYFHIDVMDGKFVNNYTVETMKEYTNQIRQISNIPLDVHLMVEDIKTFIDSYIPYEPNRITFHIEACKDKEEVNKYIKYLKENNIQVGISVKPNTKIEDILEYLPYVHSVLIMTVEPGLGGQKLIPETIEKVRRLKDCIESNNIEVDIEVDGGVNLDNMSLLKEAGANILVVGTALINSKNYKEVIEKIKE